jgi:hypothetical protein
MTEDRNTSVAEAADRAMRLEAELEASSDAAIEGDALERARAILHQWVDSVTGVVATPGVGRVVLIHDDGGESRISSPSLPMQLAPPVRWD